jgi:protein-S-isoprenylcysteine O-methyltransferase
MHLFSSYIIGPAWGLSELGLSLFKRSKAGATSRDRNSLSLIWLVNLAAVTAGVFLAFRAPAWRFPSWVPEQSMGGGLFVAGLILRWYAIIYLGRFFTVNVAIAEDHQVIQTGPYRWMRHPSYFGGMLMLLGFCIAMGNLASLLVMMVPCVWVMLWRIRIEEAALQAALGEPYAAYMRRTRRLIPLIY